MKHSGARQRPRRRTVAVGLTVLAALSVTALAMTALAQMTTGTLFLALRDSRTHLAVVPQSIVVDGVEMAPSVDPSGLVSATLGGGQHQVMVRADGYAPFEATVTVDGEATPVNTFELDRESSLSTEAEFPPLPNDLAVLEGYVVDTHQGTPVGEATVEVPRHLLTARTDAGGYFVLAVPVPSGAKSDTPVPERITVKARKEGYIPEERKNVEIVSGTTMSISVQLDKTTSETVNEVRVVDEGAEAPRLTGWRFDVVIDRAAEAAAP